MCVETNQFQTLLYDQIIACYRQHEMSILPLRDITHTGDKVSRIQGLQAYVASGRLRFSRRHTRLIEELLQFPHARHDDGPDALEMAVKEAASHVPEPQGEFHFL
jgi:predicted phage terminase large subunit-like protein